MAEPGWERVELSRLEAMASDGSCLPLLPGVDPEPLAGRRLLQLRPLSGCSCGGCSAPAVAPPPPPPPRPPRLLELTSGLGAAPPPQ